VKRYKTLKTTMLSFEQGRDTADVVLDPGAVLEFDGSTIWLIQGDKRIESVTFMNFIPVMLENGTIERVNVEDLPIL